MALSSDTINHVTLQHLVERGAEVGLQGDWKVKLVLNCEKRFREGRGVKSTSSG